MYKWLDPTKSLATWLCDFTSFSCGHNTGRGSRIRKSAECMGKVLSDCVCEEKQNFQRNSLKKLYTALLCVNILAIAMFNIYCKVLQYEERTWVGLLDGNIVNVIEKSQRQSYAPAVSGSVSHWMRQLCRM